jgi:hypothetical protein
MMSVTRQAGTYAAQILKGEKQTSATKSAITGREQAQQRVCVRDHIEDNIEIGYFSL